jgi:transposase
MERYIGIDVHAQSCTVTVKGPSGKLLRREVVQTRGEALVESVRKVRGRKYVCIEEGTQSQWLHELLLPHVEDVAVIVPPESRGNKSDKIDSDGLAETARVGKVDTRVYKAPREFAGLRAAARSYQMVSKDVARVRNRLKAVFRSRGLTEAGDDVYSESRREPWLQKLPPSSRRLAELLASELESLLPLKEQSEQWLNEEAQTHAAVARLKGVPGLGGIRAAQIVAIVVTPHRFRSSRQFWSYSGLAIVTRSSADWERREGKWVRAEVTKTRGLNRNRQPLLKSIFKSAATTVATRMTKHPLHQSYQRLLTAGTKPNLAKLTIARRIAAICLAIWKKQEDYDPAKQEPRSRDSA